MTWFTSFKRLELITKAGRLTQSGEKLVQLPIFQSVMPTLKNLVSADSYYFDELYQSAIYHLVELCQTMPQAQSGDYSDEGGLFYSIFDRVIAGLKKRQGKLMPKGEQSEVIAEDDSLWTY